MRSLGSLSTCPGGGVLLPPPRCPGPWVPVRPRSSHTKGAGCPPGCSEQRSRASVSPVCSAERGRTPWARHGQRGLGTHSLVRPPAPLPSTPGLPAAARPSHRHVLSPEECAKSLPDVRGSQPTTPSAAHRGGHRAPRTPRCPAVGLPMGPEPLLAESCLAAGPGLSQPVASGRRGLAGHWQQSGQDSGVPGRGREVRAGQGCVPSVPIPPRPHSPHPAWGPAPARWGRAGSCPAPLAPVPGRSAAEQKGAVRWNLGDGGDGAAGGGCARHVATYVRRVQGRTGRQPGRRGHR